MGSSIDDFLKEEGVFEEAQAQAVKEVVAWQLAQAMREKKISKNRIEIHRIRGLSPWRLAHVPETFSAPIHCRRS